jgi:uncharacterized membrane protein
MNERAFITVILVYMIAKAVINLATYDGAPDNILHAFVSFILCVWLAIWAAAILI